MQNNEFDEAENMDDIYETVTIFDEDGQEIDCFVIDSISHNANDYLLVVPCDSFDDDEVEAFVLKQDKEENEDIIYIPVTDENEYNSILILFQENDTDYEMKF